MIVIGLTGSIASGKSTVLRMFAEEGVPVFSADAAVHALYEGEGVGPVGAAFPDSLVDGHIDRKGLDALLLGKPEALARLEAIVHPLVREAAARFLREEKAKGTALAVLEIPLLLESPHPYSVDKIVVTMAPDAELRRRALARPGMTVAKFDALATRQLPQQAKRARADHVIDTSQSLATVRNKVRAIIEACLKGRAR